MIPAVRWLPALLVLLLALRPALVLAVDGEASDPEEASTEGPPAPAPRVDALGRPFPDPAVLRRSQGWTGGGVALTATGGALLVTGLFVGSSVARGEFTIGDGERGANGAFFGTLFGAGAALLAAGVPLASAGTFSTKQLKRTIKGAEKVPRVVANEPLYWDFYLRRQIGQGLTVSGGGAILMGVVATAGVIALVGTEYYEPQYWAGVAGAYGGGAAMIVLGILLQKDADERMEALRKRVDPYEQQATVAPRLRRPGFDPSLLIPRPAGLGVGWGFAF